MRDKVKRSMTVSALMVDAILLIGNIVTSTNNVIRGIIGNKHCNLCHLQSLSEYDSKMLQDTTIGEV